MSLKPALEFLVDKFSKQHGPNEVRKSNAFHDRFIILDNKTYFQIGSSLKDVGNKSFMYLKVEDPLTKKGRAPHGGRFRPRGFRRLPNALQRTRQRLRMIA